MAHRWAVLAWLPVVTLACGSPPPEPLEVLYGGCEFVWSGPVCEVTDAGSTLTLWVATPPGVTVSVASGGVPAMNRPPVALDGGQRIHVEVPAADGELVIETRGPGVVVGRWTLPITVRAEPEWYGPATAACRGGEFGRCRELAATPARDDDPCSSSLALGLLARIDQREERPDSAVAGARNTLAAARRCGRLNQEVWEGSYLAWLLRQRGEAAEARQVLDSLPGEGLPVTVVHGVWMGRSRSRQNVGDLRGALEAVERTLEDSRRLGLNGKVIAAGQRHATLLQLLGRSEEAGAEFDGLLRLAEQADVEVDPCDEGLLNTNLSWSYLLAREAGGTTPDPLEPLAAGLRILEEKCAWRRDVVANARLNATLAHLQEGRLAEAKTALDEALAALEAEPEIHPPRFVFWAVDLEGRAARLAGDLARAEELYRGLSEAGEAAASPDASWRAAVGLARTLEEAGRPAEALEAYARAEEVIEGWSLRVPVHEGRTLFLAQREEATRRHLEVLLAEGRADEAVAVARRAISRVPRSLSAAARRRGLGSEVAGWEGQLGEVLAERDAFEGQVWSLYRELSGAEFDAALAALAERRRSILRRLDELADTLGGDAPAPPPEPGERIVVLHPLREGWMGAVMGADGVVVWGSVAGGSALVGEEGLGDEVAASLLAVLAPGFEGVDRFRIVAHAAATGADLGIVPVAGRPLLARGPVVHSLDLPAATTPAPRGEGPVVLIGDPGGDLPAARTEVDQVSRRLRERRPSWRQERLVGRVATGPAMRQLLPRAPLAHYAGHAVFAGPGGWQSALPLARPTMLTVGDVLTLPAVPVRVVLSGCESGGSASGAGGVAAVMGMAQAFLVAGTLEVVAAVRPVDDRTAATLVVRLYRELLPGEGLAAALGRAQLALVSERPEEDWAAFRAFVR